MHHTGGNPRNSFGAKDVLISAAAALSDTLLDVVRIIPTATMRVVDKNLIDETYSFMEFSIYVLFLSLLHG
jgi:hypothetical protein